MLRIGGGADRFATPAADAQQHAILDVQRDQLAQRCGNLTGAGLLLLGHGWNGCSMSIYDAYALTLEAVATSGA
jgi:hypothetical protein